MNEKKRVETVTRKLEKILVNRKQTHNRTNHPMVIQYAVVSRYLAAVRLTRLRDYCKQLNWPLEARKQPPIQRSFTA